MKFSMTTAWNEAMAMFTANREVLLIIAGIFFFLPSLAFAIMFPQMQDLQQMMLTDPERYQQQVEAMFTDYLPLLILGVIAYLLFTLAGYLALVAMLRDHARPTVGEAIGFGAKAAVPAFLGMILLYLVMVLAALVPALLLGAGSAASGGSSAGFGFVAFIVVVLMIVVLLYLMTKFSLFLAVMGLEGTLNPVRALARSWRLTRRNSVRLFAFYVLLTICYVVIAVIVSMPAMLLVMVLGTTVAGLVNGLVSGALTAVATVLFVAILASIHRQLSGPSGEAIGEVFE